MKYAINEIFRIKPDNLLEFSNAFSLQPHSGAIILKPNASTAVVHNKSWIIIETNPFNIIFIWISHMNWMFPLRLITAYRYRGWFYVLQGKTENNRWKKIHFIKPKNNFFRQPLNINYVLHNALQKQKPELDDRFIISLNLECIHFRVELFLLFGQHDYPCIKKCTRFKKFLNNY